MKRFLRILQPSIVVVVLVAAVWLLYQELTGEYTVGTEEVQSGGQVLEHRKAAYEIFKEGLAEIDARDLTWAVGLTVLNYVILFGYDYLAIRYLKHPLPARKLMLASFVGNVASLNFGSLLGGTSVRYRFYALWKFSGLEILQLIVILGLTFWLGVCLLAGIVFLAADFPVPPRIAERLPMADVRILGVVLISLVLGYLAVCALRRRPLKILKGEVPLPPPWLSVAQIVVSCADLLVVAGVFYVLLPDAAQEKFGYFGALGVFLLGWVVAAFAHVPGGIGIFEYFNVKLVAKKAIASIVVFRAIYLLIPLIVAACLLLGHELLLKRELFKKLAAKRHGGPHAADSPPGQRAAQPGPANVVAAPPTLGHADGEGRQSTNREPAGDATATEDEA
jgi:phosphatidylglycerol lysyltransferase